MIELYELNPHKMTTPQEKVQSVSSFIEVKSDVQTQRNYISNYERNPPSRPSIKLDVQTQRNYVSNYGRNPPSRPSIRLWHKKYMETGTVFDTRKSGRPRTSEETLSV